MGYSFSPVIYRAAQFKRSIGNVDIKGKATPSLSFGLNWSKNREKEVTFRYGVHFNLLPEYNFQFKLLDGDIPNYNDHFFDEKGYGTFLLSIPLEIELQKQLGPSLYYSFQGGINLTLLSEGTIGVGAAVVIEELNEEREFFGLRSSSRKIATYPNLRLSMGFYYMMSKLLLQTRLMYQKSIPNYFTGEYLFDNLEISERTEGTYSYSGDFIGLEFVFFFRKKS